MEKLNEGNRDLASRFGGRRMRLARKAESRRCEASARLKQLVVPSTWRSELNTAHFHRHNRAKAAPKLLIVDQPSQAFAAYEYGQAGRIGDAVSFGPAGQADAERFVSPELAGRTHHEHAERGMAPELGISTSTTRAVWPSTSSTCRACLSRARVSTCSLATRNGYLQVGRELDARREGPTRAHRARRC